MAFRASAAPYLLLDADLRIRAANAAYQQATHHDIADMVSEFMFDVFPDNPATPEAQSVDRLTASFERALFSGKPDRMNTQRYDVIDGEIGFVRKSWLPINSPIRDTDGKTLGILHHVEDVTRLLLTTALERELRSAQASERPGAPDRSRGSLADLRRDSRERLTHAQTLIQASRLAMERMSQRIAAANNK